MIYNIQRFSTHDGEGIRTMIFYKGCPLRCAWCSNPESQDPGPSVMFNEKLCRNFGDCILSFPSAISRKGEGIIIDRSKIVNPERLRNLCASGALVVVGEEKDIMQLVGEVEKDMPFYSRSNGGVTLSGGEPLSAGPELEKLLAELKKRNIDRAVETSLCVPWENIERTIGLVNTYLADLKHTDRKVFRQYTKGDSVLVLGNFEKLAALGENIVIRIPVIPGFNHNPAAMRAMIDFALTLKNIGEIHFIPYHNLGAMKYKMLGMEYPFENIKRVDPSELSEYIGYATEKGFKVRTGG
jgi:pyruvate formate lyase activating enzyme